jgi:hypothetical protein
LNEFGEATAFCGIRMAGQRSFLFALARWDWGFCEKILPDCDLKPEQLRDLL